MTITLKAIAALVLSVAVAGVGGGLAEAKPMDRQHAKYCAKLRSDYDFTEKAFKTAHDKYGPNNVLTLQAASNYSRASTRLWNSDC